MTSFDAEIRTKYLAYLNSPQFDRYLTPLAGRPYWRLALAVAACMTTIGIPIGIVQLYRYLRRGSALRKAMNQAAARSVPLITYPLMVNSQLLRTPGTIAPGLVVGSFDPEANTSVSFMTDVVHRVYEIELAGAKTPQEAEVERMMANVAYWQSRRRRLPPELTEGREVYAFDLMIVGDFLPSGLVTIPMIPCLAEPGPAGQIQMIPWWVVPMDPAKPLRDDLILLD